MHLYRLISKCNITWIKRPFHLEYLNLILKFKGNGCFWVQPTLCGKKIHNRKTSSIFPSPYHHQNTLWNQTYDYRSRWLLKNRTSTRTAVCACVWSRQKVAFMLPVLLPSVYSCSLLLCFFAFLSSHMLPPFIFSPRLSIMRTNLSS